jgi:pimeloyl-ACP methyl ester carboxylesterase
MTYIVTFIFLLAFILLIAYSYPVRRIPFQHLYAKVPEEIANSLKTFRRREKLRQIEVDGNAWNYIFVGGKAETIVFLHGMGGAYDIWWQVIEALRDRFGIISVTYPAVETLEGLNRGISAILDQEKISEFYLVGSSLGGYLSQYLVSKHPQRIKKAVFANTFPPNELIAQKTQKLGKLLPLLPQWAVMLYLRQNAITSIYPAAGNSELVLAYMMEQSHGMMTKKQFIARYRCVIDSFDPPAPAMPILIIEADNDPLVEAPLREMLKQTYASADVKTLHDVGHFPYLNQPEAYTRVLLDFLMS